MPPSTVLSPKECRDLLDTLAPANGSAYQQHAKVRNTVIALLMLDAGCRREEVTRLRYRHAYWDHRPREYLDIPDDIAKYEVGGQIPISPRLSRALDNLLVEYHHPNSYNDDHYLIYRSDPTRPLGVRQVARIIELAAKEAIRRHVYPHMLRHTFIDTLRSVTDIATVQSLARHKHLSSTQVYFHVTESQRRQAIAAVAMMHNQETAP